MDVKLVSIAAVTTTPDVAVVIDVMRAFTTTAWAFERGAERIVLAGTLEEARALKADHPGWVTVKDGDPAAGFDTGNSPALIRTLDLQGRTVVQKTAAGTVGALAVKDAPLVLCASFTVAEATARLVRARARDSVTFVVTGEDGRAEEDLACAEYIAARIDQVDVTAEDFLRRAARSVAAVELEQGVRGGAHPDDVALCLELDRFSFAMVAALDDELLVLRPCPDPSALDVWPAGGPGTDEQGR